MNECIAYVEICLVDAHIGQFQRQGGINGR